MVMKLYYHPVSTTSRSILMFAADSDAPLDYQVVDLFTGEHMKPEYAAVNPSQCVPVLEDGDFRLSESSAILKYLAEKTGSPAYPSDPKRRARVNERMDWFNTFLSRELCYGFIYPQIFPNQKRPTEDAQAQTLAWGREQARHWLDVLDDGLIGEQPYICGSEISLADYMGTAMLTAGETVHIDYGHWRNISRWLASMKARPAYAQSHQGFYKYLVEPMAKMSFQPL
jgi:glutathione S-transferase